MRRTVTPSNLLLALVCTLFILSFAVVFTLNFRPLYYWDIQALELPAASGLPAAQIQENYDALVSYNSVFMRGQLVFPTLPMSEAGRIHFEEVKNIFVAVQLLMAGTFAASVVGAFVKLRKKETAFLKLTSVFSAMLPVILGIVVAVDWQGFFVFFHRLAFRNDFWLFDPATDPIISLLPNTFFMHCAIMILLLVLLGSLLCFALYIVFKKRWGSSAK